jgi:hypothetical protein
MPEIAVPKSLVPIEQLKILYLLSRKQDRTSIQDHRISISLLTKETWEPRRCAPLMTPQAWKRK